MFAPGAAFGSYTLVRLLGRGGFAEVWLARETGRQGFERRVALKVLNPHRVDDDRSLETLVNEARVGGALEHPNIVRVHAIDEVEGTWFVAMEYIEGPDLGGLLRALAGAGLRMPASIVIGIGLQIARALEYAHSAEDMEGRPLNLVHRDLKPPNVLLSRTGSVKVTDFGIAKATTNLNSTSTGTVKGTPMYMAPELWAGEREFHPRIDLFALGAMLVELATGQRLLQGDTAAAIAGQAIFGDPDEEAARLEGVLPALLPVVRGLLQRKPGERTQDAAEVVTELQSIAREVPAPADLGMFVQLVEVLGLPVPERSRVLSTLRLPIATDDAWSRLVTAARGETVEPDPILARPIPSLRVEQLVRPDTLDPTSPTTVHPDASPIDTGAETALSAPDGQDADAGAVTATASLETSPVDTGANTRSAGSVDTAAHTRAEEGGPVRLGPGRLEAAAVLADAGVDTVVQPRPARDVGPVAPDPVGPTRIVPASPPRKRPWWPWLLLGALLVALLLFVGLQDGDPAEEAAPTAPPQVTPAAATPSPVPTATATAAPTPAPTASPRPTATPRPVPTATATPPPSRTPTPTPPPTPTPTAGAATPAAQGCIAFTSEPAGAEIQIDGATAPFIARRRSPPLRSYDPGEVRVVMGRGGQAVGATVQVQAGQRARVHCALGQGCQVSSEGSCP